MLKKFNFVQLFSWVLLCGTLAVADDDTKKDETNKKSTGAIALDLMFDSQALPNLEDGLRSRALIARRSFVDLVKRSKKNLQIAIVIDGTDSMGADIEGVFKFAEQHGE